MAVLLMFSVAGAQQWQFVGTRAMGMGGAGVATAFGPDAQYWNPAGLAQEEDTNETGLLINAGVSFEATKNVLEGVRDLTDMSDQYKQLKNALNSGSLQSAEDISTLFKGLNDISKMIGKDTGALVNADAGAVFKFKNFAVSGRALGTGAITPVVDTKNIQFTGLSGALADPTAQTVPARITASEALADSITAHGVLAALNNLFGVSYTASQMADAIINALPGSVTDQQIVTSSEIIEVSNSDSGWGGTRKLPYAFTENGIAMLSSVLRSPVAIEVNIRIMRAFTAMRHFMASNVMVFQRLEVIEHHQLELSARQTDTEQKIEEVFKRLDNGNVQPSQGIFFDGQIFDAYTFVSDLIRSAKKRIVLFDNYVDDSVLAMLDKRADGVSAQIYTRTLTPQLTLDLQRHNAQYSPIAINEFQNAHDRFLCIDDTVYHIGASLKDLGKKWFAFSKMEIGTNALLRRM